MPQLRVSRGDTKTVEVAVTVDATMGDLRRAIWRITGVPWMPDGCSWGKCQVLMLRGDRMPTDDGARLSEIGVADGDVVQLVEDVTALKNGITYLHAAAREGEAKAARVLVEAADGSTDATNDFQYTALLHAAVRGQAGVVEDLVGVAADCQAANSDGYTPLHYAARDGRKEAVRALGCAGADVDAANKDGNRPLHDAAMNGRYAAASELLESGARVIELGAHGAIGELVEAAGGEK
jgi:hypothetical protein